MSVNLIHVSWVIWFCAFGLVCFFPTLALLGLVTQGHMAKIRGGDILTLMKFLHSELPFDRSQNSIFNTLQTIYTHLVLAMGAVMKYVIFIEKSVSQTRLKVGWVFFNLNFFLVEEFFSLLGAWLALPLDNFKVSKGEVPSPWALTYC